MNTRMVCKRYAVGSWWWLPREVETTRKLGYKVPKRELSKAEYGLCGCRCRYCHVWVALPKKDVCASRKLSGGDKIRGSRLWPVGESEGSEGFRIVRVA